MDANRTEGWQVGNWREGLTQSRGDAESPRNEVAQSIGSKGYYAEAFCE
jgi:hypothetical protein